MRRAVEPQLVKALLDWLVVLLLEEALELKAERQLELELELERLERRLELELERLERRLELELERRLELVILLKTKRQRLNLVDLE